MTRMPPDEAAERLPGDADPSEDIEILEVVGVDEDGVPIPESDPDDVEVEFPDVLRAGSSEALAEPVSEEAELRERLLRLHADFDNFKKRVDRERRDHFRYATFDLVGRILPVLDNFERAMTAIRPTPQGDALVEGVALIHRQLLTELEAEGLRGMESVGELFDPELHEAVATDPDADVPPHTVTYVFQRGYFLHERVLRPAMVRVRVDSGEGETATDDRKES